MYPEAELHDFKETSLKYESPQLINLSFNVRHIALIQA